MVCVCVCVCVCECVVGFLSDVSLVGSAEEQRSYKLYCTFCVISATDIDSVQGVPAWSSDM